MRFAIPLVIVAALIAVFWRGLFLHPTEVPSPLIDRTAPAFTLPQLHEPEKTLSSQDIQGRVSLVNVFGTWCPGCHEEHPVLMAWSERIGVPIYGINWAMHQENERDAAIAWLAREGNPYEAIGFDASGDTVIDWGVYGAPETFLIDSKGVVRLKHTGVLTDRVMQEKILPAINALRAEARQ